MDMDFIFAEFKKTKHPLVPTVRGLEKACDNNLGEYAFWSNHSRYHRYRTGFTI